MSAMTATPDPRGASRPVVRLAPAKLNLTLAVVGRRADGYHALHSVMVPLGLADRLSLAVADRRRGHASTSTGFDAGPGRRQPRPPGDRRDARRAVAAAPASTPPPLAVRLEKRIPSPRASPAAAATPPRRSTARSRRGARRARATSERVALAAGLGSDVPFFLAGGPALVEGRGERVTPLHGVTALTASRRAAGRPARDAAGRRPTPPPSSRPGPAARWASPGVARRTSEHFASEFGSGLSVQALLERAGVLASANDLWPAAAAVVPGLVPLRRALTRLARPPDRAVRLGPDPVGALSFARRRRRPRPTVVATGDRGRRRCRSPATASRSSPRRRSDQGKERIE